MRKRDLHILTSGVHTYTGDARFSIKHPEHSDDWDLFVEYVQKRDAGVYECQVNTEPKINLAVLLNVDGKYYPLIIREFRIHHGISTSNCLLDLYVGKD